MAETKIVDVNKVIYHFDQITLALGQGTLSALFEQAAKSLPKGEKVYEQILDDCKKAVAESIAAGLGQLSKALENAPNDPNLVAQLREVMNPPVEK